MFAASTRHEYVISGVSSTAKVGRASWDQRKHKRQRLQGIYEAIHATFTKQEAFEKCWAHSPQRAAARRITIHHVSLVSRRTRPARRCPQHQQQQRRRR